MKKICLPHSRTRSAPLLSVKASSQSVPWEEIVKLVYILRYV